MAMAMKMRTFTASLIVASFFLLQLIAGCRAYSIRRQQEDSEDEVGVDRFFFPTDEALREFQQILVRELGLSRIPDVSKANITREEYDARRLGEPTVDKVDQLEYHQFDANDEAVREKVLLDHGPVRGVRRPSRVEWTLHFKPPTEDPLKANFWKADGPMELAWSGPKSRSSKWTVRVQSGNSSAEKQFLSEENVEEDIFNEWIDQLNEGVAEVLKVTVTCQGRGCQPRSTLKARIHLTVAASENRRAKRHAEGQKKLGKKKTSAVAGHNGTNGKSRQHPSHPKDILLGDQHKRTRSNGCSTTGGKKSKKCCPHSLVLNFRKVPGFEWILEPSEIDIFMCMGDCHYSQLKEDGHHPVNNAVSNHAVFQAYLHKFNKKRVPKLCCTPSKLDSIQIVHYDPDDPSKLTTTKWTDAIVRECACA